MSEDYGAREEIRSWKDNPPVSAPIIKKYEGGGAIAPSLSFAEALNHINALDAQLRADRERLITTLDAQIEETLRLYEYVDRLRESKSQ